MKRLYEVGLVEFAKQFDFGSGFDKALITTFLRAYKCTSREIELLDLMLREV